MSTGSGEDGETIVTAFSIGDLVFGTVPGEAVPDLGLELRRIMGGEHRFLITLGMDWLGCVMTPEQCGDLRYIYFSVLSVGPESGPTLIEAYNHIFDSWSRPQP